MTIVTVTPKVAKTCVVLQDASGYPWTCDDVLVLIRRAGWIPPKKQWVWIGCQHVEVCVACHQPCGHDDNRCTDWQYNRLSCGCVDIPTLEYPAFDTDDQGRVCFHWDDLLYRQPPGRYTATIINRERCPIGYFEIELARDNVYVCDAVSVPSRVNCGMCE